MSSSTPTSNELAVRCGSDAVTEELTPAEARWENEGGAAQVASDPRRGTVAIDPVDPFRLDLTVWALRRRSLNTLDLWDGTTYRRTLLPMGTPVEVCVTEPDGSDVPI